ncbi:MAG: MmcQ/YjbR family DNA-binding protein [Nitrosomonadales bacterium]|nr:MmcQ/YjbR family DNA-binding protein [Nitrosomonadales bacterium]
MTLSEARQLALSLPEATEQPHHELSSFRVRGRIFATVARDQQHLHIFVDDLTREQAIELLPDVVEKLWWGEKVMGVRVALPKIDARTLKDLLHKAWQRKAPKSLLRDQVC